MVDSIQEPQSSPFFPEPSTTRPAIVEHNSSDSSITTVSSVDSDSSHTSSFSTTSTSSNDSSSLNHPYARLVLVDRTESPASSLDLFSQYDDRIGSSRSDSFASTSSADRDQVRAALGTKHTLSKRTGVVTSSSPNTTSSSLYPSANAPWSSPPVEPSKTPQPEPASPSSSLPSPQTRHAATYPPATTSFRPTSPTTSAMLRTGSSPRPSSSGTTNSSNSTSTSSSSRASFSSFGSSSGYLYGSGSTSSSGSSRPWVFDSDASSVCSAGSRVSCSSGRVEDSVVDAAEDGEVYKVNGAEGIEFLDPRPEPAGAFMTINRDDPLQVVLSVRLEGFSLDNITVAMRRGHKVHIVADKYTEGGGHFEKLVSLGSEIVSAAPRAEFNGTELRVYVQRRQPRHPPSLVSRSSTSSTASTVSTASTTSTSNLSINTATSPILPDYALSESEESPVITCGEICKGKGAGPEAAKAAAKKAKEEAAMRAKEAAKNLPKVGRKIAFKSALLGRSSPPTSNAHALEGSSSSSASSSNTPTPTATPAPTPPSSEILNHSVKGKERNLRVVTDHNPRALSPIPSSSPPSATSSSSSSLSSSSSNIDFKNPSPSFASSSDTDSSIASSPTRPKLDRDLHLTLRAKDGKSFLQAATDSQHRDGDDSSEEYGRSEVVTPKVERGELFGMSSISNGIRGLGFGFGAKC